MAEVTNPGLSSADVIALIAANSALSFVNSGQYLTIDQLNTNFPAGSAYSGMYANVANLFNGVSATATGGVREVVRCRPDITNGTWNWTAQRNDFNLTMNVPTGTITLINLVSPPTLRITGNLLSSPTITPPLTSFVGDKRRIIMNGTLGALVNLTVNNLIGGSGSILGNTFKDIEYGVGGWFAAN